MFGQTFSLLDLPNVLILAFLELVLSADNALILAVITKKLPERLRQKALYVGFFSAFILRLIAILSISYLAKFFWFQLIGALYLLYLSIHYWFKREDRSQVKLKAPVSFLKTVFMIEFFDLAFAIDSIVSGVAFITHAEGIQTAKLWIVYVGGMIGAFAIRKTAYLIGSLMNRFVRLEPAAYLLVGWIGLKLALSSLGLFFPYFSTLFWIGLLSIIAWGVSRNERK